MTRWPSKLLLLLSVAAALQLLPQLLALCVGAGAATGGYGNDSNSVELYPATVPPHKTALVIGYLTAIKGYIKDRQGLSISGALTMALDEINNDRNLLPNVLLQMRWNDTRGDTVLATRAMTDMICDGVVSFFGPEGPCYVEAIVSQSRNIPMISYRCSDYKASSIPTFARTEPPDTQVTKSVISLLMYYGWKKFSIIYEESWMTVANSLKEQATVKNMTINHFEQKSGDYKCCENVLSCCRGDEWFQLIQNTKNRTRIYVFLGSSTALVAMMSSMDDSLLFAKGEYMVIFVDMMTYSLRSASAYLWKTDHLTRMVSCQEDMEKLQARARSLLVVVSTEPTVDYTNFLEQVRAYNSKAPFNFTTPRLFIKYDKFISISAAYLYDSVRLYAWALDKLLRQQPQPVTPDVIRSVSLDGARIIETIIQNRTYKSVTGATIKIDKNGDSEGNFSVLALKEFNYTLPDKTIACTRYMVPVAYFHQGDDFPEYKIVSASMRIDWLGNEKPADQPICGFHDELCPKDDQYLTSVIVACTLGLVLFCISVITLSIYRKWKIELEIEGLLWRIEPKEVKGFNFNMNNDIVASPSKLSLVSAASFGSRCSNQVFTTTGRYRGMVVRMKELKYARKKDISRDIMKEMRLLRDLRHDNINSFIGAVVEPMRTLLVTDYCAKGSLYDIVENEDIKLDEMFVASLVHDLIKGMIYIHDSALNFHGNLKSSNCVVTSRWMLQVSDFGLHDLRHCAESESIGEHQYYRNQFWKAPELLRDTSIFGSKEADVYAFAIILYEMIGRKGPFGQIGLEPKEIVESVRDRPANDADAFRPDMECIMDSSICAEYVINCIRESWDENPAVRPDFPTIRQRLKRMRGGKSRNIMDQIMELMEKYANNLEDVVNERTRQLCDEKRKTEDLLHRMLPESVADSLTRGLGVEPVSYNSVTIYFSDIVGFTALSAISTPLQVVNFLNDLYTLFDRVIKGYDVYKVETIGDAYMVVSGLPIGNGERHVGEIASMSLDLLYAIRHHRIAHRPQEVLKLRVGMHTGPVVAGVVGLTMPRYCLFGDTVNTASRMESNGEALRIHISTQCKEALDRLGGYVTEDRGRIQMKGKGEVQTYWLVGATETAVQRREVNLDLPPLFSRPRYSPRNGMSADSRQTSSMALNYFGSRRQSGVPRGDAISMHSLTGAIITQQPSPTRNSSRSSSQRHHLDRPILLACDSTAATAMAAAVIADDCLRYGNSSTAATTEPHPPPPPHDGVDDEVDQLRRPLLISEPTTNAGKSAPSRMFTDHIRQPLLIRPSHSMDTFPTVRRAGQPGGTTASRLRRRVDSAISLVVGGHHNRKSFGRRHRSSRSLDAVGSAAGAASSSTAVALIDNGGEPVAARRENGTDAAPQRTATVVEMDDLMMASTDLGPAIVPYKPYLNNNCNGGGGGGGAAASGNGGNGNNISAHSDDSVEHSLLLRHSSLTGATATDTSALSAVAIHSTPAVLPANSTTSQDEPQQPQQQLPQQQQQQQQQNNPQRWHSLDPMGDGSAVFADHDSSINDDAADPLDGSGGKKALHPRGSIKSWLVGLFQGRGGGGGGGGGAARAAAAGPVIVPAATATATTATRNNHNHHHFGELSGPATPESESIV